MNAPRTTSGTRAIVAASLGNLLEWYDFAVYALFAVYIGANFFPPGDPGAGLVKAFLVFGLGFVIRPLGAVVIGIYGDRAGRKAALTATILVMACGTLIIAAAPTYAMIGLGAAWVLMAGRTLQGFSAGGEIGSAAAFLVEHAPGERRALFAAWLQASMGMSNILGALTAFTLTAFVGTADLTRYAWRIPFLIGLAIVPFGLYLRRTLGETPAFEAEAARALATEPAARRPLRQVFTEHPRQLAAGFGISILWAIEVYVLLIFMPVFLQRSLGFTPKAAFGGSLAQNVVFVAGCFAFGALADRIGAWRVQTLGALSILVVVLPLFAWLDHTRSLGVLVCVLCALGLVTASFAGVAPTALSALFPTAVRATGVSLAYNAGFTLFGGFAPAILAALAAHGAGVYAPAWFVMLAALPALLALHFAGSADRGAAAGVSGARGAHLSAAGAAVAALDPARLRALAQRSDARGLRQLGLHALILMATGAAVAASRGHTWLPAVMVLHGIALDFLFCALHESAHRTAFASRRLNEALAWGAGALLILPPRFFRAFHFAHHRHAQDPGRDPELARPPPATLAAYLWHLSGMPNWSRRISVTLRHALTRRVREQFVAERQRPAIVREAQLLWAIYGAVLVVSLLLRSGAALIYWIVPAMLGQPFLRGFLLAEHTGCALGDDPFTNTRTTYTNAALRALSWQMPFHVEHHAHPAVPFHALGRLNALYRSRIGVSAPGYWAVHRALVRRLRTGPGAASGGAG